MVVSECKKAFQKWAKSEGYLVGPSEGTWRAWVAAWNAQQEEIDKIKKLMQKKPYRSDWYPVNDPLFQRLQAEKDELKTENSALKADLHITNKLYGELLMQVKGENSELNKHQSALWILRRHNEVNAAFESATRNKSDES